MKKMEGEEEEEDGGSVSDADCRENHGYEKRE